MLGKETDINYYVGVIDFDDIENYLNEITGVNLGENLGKCSIVVRGNEGPIPHFHIVGSCKSKVRGVKGNFESCICIYKPLYFNHGKYQDILTKKQKEKLNEWLMQPSQYQQISGTNWDVLCVGWALADNPMMNVPKNAKQPDYRYLENMTG